MQQQDCKIKASPRTSTLNYSIISSAILKVKNSADQHLSNSSPGGAFLSPDAYFRKGRSVQNTFLVRRSIQKTAVFLGFITAVLMLSLSLESVRQPHAAAMCLPAEIISKDAVAAITAPNTPHQGVVLLTRGLKAGSAD